MGELGVLGSSVSLKTVLCVLAGGVLCLGDSVSWGQLSVGTSGPWGVCVPVGRLSLRRWRVGGGRVHTFIYSQPLNNAGIIKKKKEKVIHKHPSDGGSVSSCSVSLFTPACSGLKPGLGPPPTPPHPRALLCPGLAVGTPWEVGP